MYKFLFSLLIITIVTSKLHYKPSQQPFIETLFKKVGDLPKGNTCTKPDPKQVHEEFPDTQIIYSGYLNVIEGSQSCLGYIFYGSQKALTPEALSDYPTIIWLNGGPGSSSQLGNFMELGPIIIQKDGTKTLNKFSWNVEYNVMFVDQPIGTGLSYFEKEEEIPTNQDMVAEQFLHALIQFFTGEGGCVKTQNIDKLKTSPWFVFGESYAGKYVPSIGEIILNYNKKDDKVLEIPLRGVAIGDPFTDPYAVMAEYSTYSYNFGIIDVQERSKSDSIILYGLTQLNKGNTIQAREAFEQSLDLIITQSGGMNVYNVLQYGNYGQQEAELEKYLNLAETKTLFGFSQEWVYKISNSDDVAEGPVTKALKSDFMKRDCVGRVENVLKSLPFLIYNGQNDLICSTPGTLRWVYELNHTGSEEYKKGDLALWKLASNDKVVGYKKKAGNLELALVNNAGHLVPTDQPEAALELVKDFVERHKKK